jgi:uncharacterized membrane protein
MENFIKIALLIFILAVPVIITFLAIQFTHKRKTFKKYLKVGDVVSYYVGQDKSKCTVVSLGDVYCKIRDEFGDVIKVQRVEIYPDFWTIYRPKDFIE